ncbi:MAG: hypothetical protein ACM3PT_13710 [Deltaproteobacteria bacterium]
MATKKQTIKKKLVKPVKKNNSTTRKFGLYIAGVLILAIIGIIFFTLLKPGTSRSENRHLMNSGNMAIVQCMKNPSFPQKFGLNPPYAIDLKQDMFSKGMKIIEATTGKILQLPGWDSFGYLGLYTRDDVGNIYTSPVPYVSIKFNSPEDQNRILRVDNNTGVMQEFIRLPSVNKPTQKNPYGVIGLGFDCETKSLYATSVSGSSFDKETGKVYQINPVTKEIIDTYDDFDALGIALYVGVDGKRAYLGHARKPDIYSVGINEDGSFKNDLRFEFSLVDVPNGSYNKAHRITIQDDVMTLKTREFSYTLITASDVMRTVYKFSYDRNEGKWKFNELAEE